MAPPHTFAVSDYTFAARLHIFTAGDHSFVLPDVRSASKPRISTKRVRVRNAGIRTSIAVLSLQHADDQSENACDEPHAVQDWLHKPVDRPLNVDACSAILIAATLNLKIEPALCAVFGL